MNQTQSQQNVCLNASGHNKLDNQYMQLQTQRVIG